VLLLAAIAGCEVSPTQLLVVVNTDLAVPAEVDEVRIRVRGPGSDPPREDRSVSLTDAPGRLPASFGVAPRDGDPDRRVTVAADALLDGAVVVTTSAATAFVEQKTLRLDLFLARGCRNVTCPEGQTCRDEGCESVDVDPDDLPTYEPGEDLGPPPPEWPPGDTILLPIEPGTELRDIGMDVAPDGAIVVVGSFRGGVTLGAAVSADRWAGFVARIGPDGGARYRQVLRSTDGDALLYAVTVTDDDETWVSGGCAGTAVRRETVAGDPLLVTPCAGPTRYDWPVDPDGTFGEPTHWLARDPLAVHLALDARSPWIASVHVETGTAGPTFSRWTAPGDIPESCSIEGTLSPWDLALEDGGVLLVVGAFEGAIEVLGLESAGGTDTLVLEIVDVAGGCSTGLVAGRGSTSDDAALGVVAGAGSWAMVGRQDGEDGFALATGAVISPRLGGPGAERLTGVAAVADGKWIVVGASSPEANLGGAFVDALGGSDAIVLGLDDRLELAWDRALGGPGDDEALGVELDPLTGDVIVLGLTTAPSDLDPAGTLADGQRAIFVHRFAPP